MLWVIILLLVVLIIWYTQFRVSVDKFQNALPRSRFPSIVKEFGDPDVLFNIEDGFAMWKNKGIFSKIILKDESLPHREPHPHCDFLYAVVQVHLPENSIDAIGDLGKYDTAREEITVRCHTLSSVVALLLMIMKISENPADQNGIKDKSVEIFTNAENNYAESLQELKELVDLIHSQHPPPKRVCLG